MGWNCGACGELLIPIDPMSENPRKHSCNKCGARWLIVRITGQEGSLYQNSVMICTWDGEITPDEGTKKIRLILESIAGIVGAFI